MSLAKEYATSPTPVRDALGRLRQEGLITRGPGRSYRVTPLTLADVRELAELRYVLESGIVHLVIERATPEDIEQLRQVSQLEDAGDLSGPQLIERNRAFHLAVAKLSGNQRAVAALTRVLDDSERLFHIGIRALPRDQMEQGHLSLVEAIQARDVDTAMTICKHEAFDTSERVLQMLLREPWGVDTQRLGAISAQEGA
jgi:DNA-binding GntR family transcriptional regulator